MIIELTKLSDERHRLAVSRPGGAHEAAELETRSFLLHDLVHYAVEAEAGITDGFWGLLAEGHTLSELSNRTMTVPLSMGLALAERLVGPMQSVWNGRLDVNLYVEQACTAAPDLVNAAFVARVRERLRGLWGEWRATPYRGTMELPWPPRTSAFEFRPAGRNATPSHQTRQ